MNKPRNIIEHRGQEIEVFDGDLLLGCYRLTPHGWITKDNPWNKTKRHLRTVPSDASYREAKLLAMAGK